MTSPHRDSPIQGTGTAQLPPSTMSPSFRSRRSDTRYTCTILNKHNSCAMPILSYSCLVLLCVFYERNVRGGRCSEISRPLPSSSFSPLTSLLCSLCQDGQRALSPAGHTKQGKEEGVSSHMFRPLDMSNCSFVVLEMGKRSSRTGPRPNFIYIKT